MPAKPGEPASLANPPCTSYASKFTALRCCSGLFGQDGSCAHVAAGFKPVLVGAPASVCSATTVCAGLWGLGFVWPKWCSSAWTASDSFGEIPAWRQWLGLVWPRSCTRDGAVSGSFGRMAVRRPERAGSL